MGRRRSGGEEKNKLEDDPYELTRCLAGREISNSTFSFLLFLLEVAAPHTCSAPTLDDREESCWASSSSLSSSLMADANHR